MLIQPTTSKSQAMALSMPICWQTEASTFLGAALVLLISVRSSEVCWEAFSSAPIRLQHILALTILRQILQYGIMNRIRLIRQMMLILQVLNIITVPIVMYSFASLWDIVSHSRLILHHHLLGF